MTKEEFMQQYILSRTSHKKSIDDLCNEANQAWEYIQTKK